MPTTVAQINVDDIRGAFRQWQAEHEPLEAQLRESLDALLAYQSQLDCWQQQLAGDRQALNAAREEFDRAKSDTAQGESSRIAELSAELTAAREKVAMLSTSLLERTDELRALDNRRAELTTELELAKAREKELRVGLEENKSFLEQERCHWTEELRQLREIIAQGALSAYGPAIAVDEAEVADQVPPVEQHESEHSPPNPASQAAGNAAESQVFGSVLQQFGKLRQQRAMERPPLRKVR